MADRFLEIVSAFLMDCGFAIVGHDVGVKRHCDSTASVALATLSPAILGEKWAWFSIKRTPHLIPEEADLNSDCSELSISASTYFRLRHLGLENWAIIPF
ncbi:hypothetical protein [Methylocapsa sp. S129]|uniref:hypothetical protein n=1 Tax=Methylocapsa sp. S129 TaxID=1641869 RepID=UPI00131DE627|nr:hypothetical protein [Methylocapsa sp. S129]